MRQPIGAAELIKLRLAGKRPASPIVVTDTPVVSQLNKKMGSFVLFAEPGAYDMRCIHGLPVIVWCFGDDQLGIVESVARAEPSELGVMSWEATKGLVHELWRTA